MRMIFDVLFGLLILTVAFSFACIKSYLIKHKIVKFKIWYFNPYTFLASYIYATKNVEGKIGVWFWVLVVSFFSLLLLGLFELIFGIVKDGVNL